MNLIQKIIDESGMRSSFYVLSLLLFLNCSGEKKSARLPGADTGQASVDTNVRRSDEGTAAKPGTGADVLVRASTWAYAKTVDKMGNPVYKASVTSPNLLQFDFPYVGGSTATLTIRKRDNSTNVYVEVSKGQFNRSFQVGSARIRFDNKPPVSYSLLAAENGRANIIFFDSEQKLINQIKASRTMTLELEFAGQGKRQIEFRTVGLKWL